MKTITKLFIALAFIATNFSSNAQCFEIESILVDACAPGGMEGQNEMVRFKVGAADLCTDDMDVTWATTSNPWGGVVQNAGTAQTTADLNATIVGCGELIEPTSCVLPANSTVILVTSYDMDVASNSFANLNETIYIIYHNATTGNGGHFGNYNSTPGLRTLTMSFSSPAGCNDQVTYQRADLLDQAGGSSAQDGATANFTPAGVVSYSNTGCQAPFEPFEVDMTGAEVISGTQNICPGDVITIGVNISGPYNEITWVGLNGTFDAQDVTATNYNSAATDNVDFYIYVNVETTCGDIIQDSVLFNVNASPTVTAAGPFTTFDGTQTMVANMSGGTWSADCGACINTSTGVFDPSVSGEGTFQICYDAGCGQDCISVLVDDDCTLGWTIDSSDPTCFEGNDGDVNITVTGVVGTVLYIISDQLSGGTQLNITNSSPTANNLTEGWYYFNVTDANCTIIDSIFLDDPDDFIIDLVIDEPDCFGIADGIAFVDTVENHSGDYSQMSFQWSQGSLGSNLVSNDSLYNMGANTYYITVTDQATGCQKVEEFIVEYPDSIYFDELGFDQTVCRNQIPFDNGRGQVFAAAIGGSNGNGQGTNFNYVWTEASTGNTTVNSTWGNRNPGFYTIVATNDLGCSITETIYVDSLSPEAIFTLTSNDFTSSYEGTAVVNIELINESINYAFSLDPNADTTFIWTFGKDSTQQYVSSDINEVITTQYLTEGEYEICLVVIENLNGCKDTACQTIIVHDQPSLDIPNVFTPDNDGVNDTFFFPNSAIVDFKCKVYDRWGKQVFEFTNITDVWNGTNYKNDKNCTEGVYFYVYEGESSNGTGYKGQGNIQLIRK